MQGTPEKRVGVAEKGGTPEMEVAGIDICVSVCSLLNRLTAMVSYMRPLFF